MQTNNNTQSGKFSGKWFLLAGLLFLMAIIYTGCQIFVPENSGTDRLETAFLNPPDSARPWVYWFWLNSNITREGITADLEAMKAAGIGGVLIMEVDQGAPVGPVAFASPQWLDLFNHVLSEADRLGLEVNMNNDAGWNGSGGPWVKVEQSMQKITTSETSTEGPRPFREKLPQPQAVANYYRDINVLAFPTPVGNTRIPDIGDKAAYSPGLSAMQAPALWPEPAAEEVIAPSQLIDLTAKMDGEGMLTWDVPAGKWTILRIGHTTTGKENHPTPASGSGFECDKMSKEAAETHFAGLMGKIIERCGPLVGKSLVATHIDSWENGSQNWTPSFREEFRQRRGYDLTPFFPVMTGRIVGSRETSERFLWDLRQTVNELVLQNYAGHFREMARRNGLRLSIEPYTWCPCDELAYGGCADEPMGEFWSWWFNGGRKYGFSFSCTQAASAAHIYGKKIVGAEAFTACDLERWLGHPANIKDLGDWAFCEGINRFVFHRYAMQPWLHVAPGMSMGPWGLHYERTQTWWDMSRAWHQYLARCQHLLRQGLFVADVCYLGAEASPQSIYGQKRFLAKPSESPDPGNDQYPRERMDYSFDLCSAEALLTRMSVKDNRLVLPDGMSYRLLVLPNMETMTPKLLAKIKELVEAGATIVGSRPSKSPSLSDYPACDRTVQALAAELWGPGEAPAPLTERQVGKGRLFWSAAFQRKSQLSQTANERLGPAQWIWYPEGNPAASAPAGRRYFRKTFSVAGEVKSAELTLTADNTFSVWLNGQPAGNGDTHTRIFTFDAASLLQAGENVLAIEAVNATDAPSPAGLIGALRLETADGGKQIIVTDKSWLSAEKAGEDWISSAAADGWAAAQELGPLGMNPWGPLETPVDYTDMYPEVDLVTEVLQQMGVHPDFRYQTQSTVKSLRYIHRREGGTDIYFIANKLPQAEQTLCSFRVQGKRPELWWPQTGCMERPAVYSQTGGITSLPICFNSTDSVFVIFREESIDGPDRIVSVTRNGDSLLDTFGQMDSITLTGGQEGCQALIRQPGTYVLQTAAGRSRELSVPALPSPLELPGPWQLSFPANGGAPDHVTLDKLISWSEHPDSGVKYFSGTAAYAKEFQIPADLLAKNRRLYLDLGEVQVMAEVKLNGKDLGILWKPPFCVDITEAAAAGNRLEIKVVNLWINRMIGDEFLPEDCSRNPDGTLKEWPQWVNEGKPSPTGRFTFTSWKLWSKDQPLQPSGLIGPVTIRAAEQIILP